MRKDLQDKLYDAYPKIFANKDKPASVTSMCWGIQTGDGWFDLLNSLCSNIQHYVDNTPGATQVVAEQVKEKFGGLRFYVKGSNDYVDGMIRQAEAMSAYICEECGDRGKLREVGRWQVLCVYHHDQLPVHEISENSDVMTVEDFEDAQRSTAIVPSDGFGYWATEEATSHIEVWDQLSAPEWATHVVWFNK